MPPEVYFHVGLERTATTFLQTQVFPAMRGVEYVPKADFRHAAERITHTQAAKVLVSHEFDSGLERAAKDFTEQFPDAHPIIAFRRQDSWIVSQYKRHIKKGHRTRFRDFIDLENDRGYYKKSSLHYTEKLRLLERYFRPEPLVLLFEDLKDRPEDFVQQIADYVGCTYAPDQLNLNARHVSYADKQLKALWEVGKVIPLRPEPENYGAKWPFEMLRLLGKGVRYTTLSIAEQLPKRWLPEGEFVSETEVERIRAYFQKDWRQVQQYAKSQSH